MKRKYLIILFSCILITLSGCSIGENKTIDMTGENGMWKASLNINVGYDNDLIIKLAREEFDPPSRIGVDVIAKGKSLYNGRLEIKEDNFPDFGLYKAVFDSVKDLEKDYEDVVIVVDFNNETITIPLDSIKIIE